MLVIALMSLLLAAPEADTPDWEREAAARIDEHRKATFTIAVNPDETVHVELIEHEFRFGSQVASPLIATLPDEHPYKRHFLELFNHGTTGNYFKWYAQEETGRVFSKANARRSLADYALRWMTDHGKTFHAHVILWATLKYGVPMPDDVEAVLTQESHTNEDRQFLRDAVLTHARQVVTRYKGRVAEWDVLNEHVAEHEISKVTHPDDPHVDPLIVELFKVAHEADPDARLFINDFGILQGVDEPHRDKYARMIQFLLDNGAPVQGIGMQSHYWKADLRLTPDEMLACLDRFGEFGLPIQVTEFDMYGGGWGETRDEREAAQAEYLRQFLTLAFSHPAVSGVTMWGIWDGQHWTDEGVLFREDWTPKPSYHVFKSLVHDEWRTVESVVADDAGEATFRGFRGRYRVTAGYDVREVELTEDGQVVELR